MCHFPFACVISQWLVGTVRSSHVTGLIEGEAEGIDIKVRKASDICPTAKHTIRIIKPEQKGEIILVNHFSNRCRYFSY